MALLHGISVYPDRTDVRPELREEGKDFFCHHREKHRGGIGGHANVLSVILPVFTKEKEFTGTKKKGFLVMMDGIRAPGLTRSFPGPVLPAFLSVSCLSGSTGPS